MGWGGFLLKGALSIGVGALTTAVLVTTGPVGGLAFLAVKGVEFGVIATGVGAVTGVATARALDIEEEISRAPPLFTVYRRGSTGNRNRNSNTGNSEGSKSGGSDTNRKTKSSDSGQSSKRSCNESTGAGAGDPNRPGGRKGYSSKCAQDLSDEEDNNEQFASTESAEIIVSSSSDVESIKRRIRDFRYRNPENRSHRYGRIHRYFALSGYHTTFELDHAPSLLTLKKILAKIKKYLQNGYLPSYLERVADMLKIFFRTNDLLSIDENNLRLDYGDILFVIFSIKVVHRNLDSTGFSAHRYSDEVAELFLNGNILGAFMLILQDYHDTIMAQLYRLDLEMVVTLYIWIISYINYLHKKKIITDDERKKLIDFAENSINTVLDSFEK